MKPLVSGRILGAVAAVALLSPLAAVPSAAQMPGGSYQQSCRDVQVSGNRITATCRTQDGRWTQTSIGNIGQCAGGVANSDGRLVCGTRGGGFNTGSISGGNRDQRDSDRHADRDRRGDDQRGDRDWRDDDRRADREHRWRRDREWGDNGWQRDRDWNGSGPYYGPAPARDPWGRW